jgi:hypothetical protein
MRRALLTAVILASASVAAADEVLLENGGKLVGRATRSGDDVIVKTPTGEFRVPATQVKSITPGRTVWDEYDEKLKAADQKDAKTQLELGDWCKGKGLTTEGRRHWKKAIEIDPDQADARARLGYIRYEERWLTNDEYYKARGFVKVGGEWVPEDEARRRDAAKIQKAAFEKHIKTIRNALTKLSSMKRKTRAEGKLDLQQYAESIGDTALGSFASDVAQYMNSYWRSYREALALVEVRATQATLRRPIPTLTTSLGAFTTPVTIQLPEVSVVSVKTTVLVPADIELDDE